MSVFVDSFRFMGDNTHLLLSSTGEHLLLSLEAVAISLAIAIPLGVWLGHIRRFSFVAINISNIGRALPSLAVIALTLPFFGVTNTTIIVALVVLAVPPILTNVYVAVAGVEPDAVEAAVGMGMRPTEVLRRVELPLALPLMFAGIRTATVYVIATATLGGFFGGSGLGNILANQASYHLSGVVAAAIWVAVLALLADLGVGALQRGLTPRGLRDRGPSALAPSAHTT